MTVSTRFDGPISNLLLSLGGTALHVAVPADLDRLLDDPEVVALNARDGSLPYWAQLWPGAYLLAEAVIAADWPEGIRALEIGCGLGLAGLAALSKGLRVVFSDRDETPLAFVAKSVRLNGFPPQSYELRPLDWRDEGIETFPFILGADVVYESSHVPIILNLLSRTLEPEGQAWLAGHYRAANEEFDEKILENGEFSLEKRPIKAMTETGRSLEGTLRIITRGR